MPVGKSFADDFLKKQALGLKDPEESSDGSSSSSDGSSGTEKKFGDEETLMGVYSHKKAVDELKKS